MGRVLYVAGYGRSGSTVLDVILGSHEEMCSVGEVAFLPEELTLPARRCACGAAYPGCEFWGGLLDALDLTRTERGLVDCLRGMESRRGLLRMLAGRPDPEAGRRYGTLHAKLFARIRERSGCAVVVDSSKSAAWTAGRPLALERWAGQDVYLLHLVRGASETVGSVVRHGSNWAAEGRRAPLRLPALRTAAGWTLAHLSARAVGRRLPPRQRLRVRYDDLIRDPGATLEAVGDWLGVDLADLGRRAAAGEAFPVGHGVGGNRLRRDGPVRLWRPAEGSPPDAELPLRARLVGGTVGRWLGRRLEKSEW